MGSIFFKKKECVLFFIYFSVSFPPLAMLQKFIILNVSVDFEDHFLKANLSYNSILIKNQLKIAISHLVPITCFLLCKLFGFSTQMNARLSLEDICTNRCALIQASIVLIMPLRLFPFTRLILLVTWSLRKLDYMPSETRVSNKDNFQQGWHNPA